MVVRSGSSPSKTDRLGPRPRSGLSRLPRRQGGDGASNSTSRFPALKVGSDSTRTDKRQPTWRTRLRSFNSLLTRLRLTGAAVHAVVMRTSSLRMTFQGTFGLAQFPSWANRARGLMLDIGPEQTSGHRIDISTTNGLPEVLSRLALELTSQYRVVYAGSDLPPMVVPVLMRELDSFLRSQARPA